MTYPGARRPDRHRWVSSNGLRLAVCEWGPPEAPPIVMAHGGFDFAGTYDVFAPLLVERGFRCISWDARGHGDSDWSVLYSWGADLRDALAVLDTVSAGPIPFLGHSKGGGVMLELADACPHRASHVINLDGLPSKNNWPDVSDRERTRMVQTEVTGWLDHRRAAVAKQRRADTLDGPGGAPGPDEPPPRPRLAPLPGHDRRPPRSRRVALEARPDAAHGRFRAVAPRVVDAAGPRHRGALPRRARPRGRSHGLGHHRRRRGALPPARRRFAPLEGVGPLRAHRTAPGGRRPGGWTSSRERPPHPPRWSSCATVGPSSPCTTCVTAPAGRCCCCTAWPSARPDRPPGHGGGLARPGLRASTSWATAARRSPPAAATRPRC